VDSGLRLHEIVSLSTRPESISAGGAGRGGPFKPDVGLSGALGWVARPLNLLPCPTVSKRDSELKSRKGGPPAQESVVSLPGLDSLLGNLNWQSSLGKQLLLLSGARQSQISSVGDIAESRLMVVGEVWHET